MVGPLKVTKAERELGRFPGCCTQEKDEPEVEKELYWHYMYMLWFNFIIGLNFISLCFRVWLCMIMS